MNINMDIVTRALQKAGQEPLTDEDIEKNSTRYRTIHSFYLATLMETLAKTSWTSQKRRKSLLKYKRHISGYDYAYSLPSDLGRILRLESDLKFNIVDGKLYTDDTAPHLFYIDVNEYEKETDLIPYVTNLTEYKNDYILPDDCAKPEQLIDNEEFIIEGRRLYTDAENAVLMYISNANISRSIEIEENGDLYLVLDDNGNLYWNGEGDTPYDIENDHLYFTQQKEYENFGELNADPMLEEFLETRLAAKIALKITGDKETYQTLYSESLIIEQQAEAGTNTHAKSKKNGNPWWTDSIGMGDRNVNY